MPTHTQMIQNLRRLVVATATYALAVALVALTLPTVLTPVPVAAFLPEPSPVVARVPVASPPTGPAS